MPKRILGVGEVLFDHFPGGERLGGAPCNFAIHARGLGADAQLLTRVGDDNAGRRIRNQLAARGFNMLPVQVDPVNPTGAVHVRFNEAGEPAYDIAPAAWDHITLGQDLRAWLRDFSFDLLYFGTLLQRSPQGEACIDGLAEMTRGACMLMCDLNLREGHVVASRVYRSLELSDILKLNEIELDFLSSEMGLSGTIRKRLEILCARFDISMIALTRGKSGSTLLFENACLSSPGTQVSDPVNTVGAGDAFSAALAVGVLAGEVPLEILNRAGRLAAAVCRLPGAVPQDKEFYMNFSSPFGPEE